MDTCYINITVILGGGDHLFVCLILKFCSNRSYLPSTNEKTRVCCIILH